MATNDKGKRGERPKPLGSSQSAGEGGSRKKKPAAGERRPSSAKKRTGQPSRTQSSQSRGRKPRQEVSHSKARRPGREAPSKRGKRSREESTQARIWRPPAETSKARTTPKEVSNKKSETPESPKRAPSKARPRKRRFKSRRPRKAGQWLAAMAAGWVLIFGGLWWWQKGDKTETSAPPADEKVDPARLADRTVSAINQRHKTISSFQLEGWIDNLVDGESTPFILELQQPHKLRVDLPRLGKTFLFDGKWLSTLEEKEGFLMRKDLGKRPPEEQMVELLEIFDPYLQAGFRAPLLNPDVSTLRATYARQFHPPHQGHGWRLGSPLIDKNKKEVHYYLRRPHADFLYKDIISHSGAVVGSSRVIQEYRHADLDMSFPKTWEERNAKGEVTRRVALDTIQINHPIAKEKFIITPPEGTEIIDVQ